MFGSSELSENEDTGPVYVREKGQLLRVGAQSFRLGSRPARLFSRGFSVELCVRREDTCTPREKPFIFTYTEQGNLRYSAKSLFTLALDLIADNVQHVDSLLGFPEQVAEKLFTAAEARQQFSKPHSGLVALRKFTEAYGDLMLTSLCLRGKYLLVSEKLEEIKSFEDLRSLDLSCCKLGDDHELMQHFTSHTLTSLRELFLKDNCLSDVGIRKMTAPVRVMNRGLGHLTLLDLSGNPKITDRGVKFLFAFKQLRFLDISDTGVQDAAAVKKNIEAAMGLCHTPKPLTQFDHIDCHTRGWAEQLFTQWDSFVASAIKPRETLKTRTTAQNFYGKEKTTPDTPEACSAEVTPSPPCRLLQFHRPDGGPHKASSVSSSGKLPVKRAHSDRTQDVPLCAPSAKRHCVALSSEDWDLLNSY